MEMTTVGWLAALAVLVVGAFYVYRLTGRLSKDRLMRCPETGAIALVGVERRSSPDGGGRDVEVEHCGLWPEKAGCAQNCLERYDETSPGVVPVNTDALRPFQQR